MRKLVLILMVLLLGVWLVGCQSAAKQNPVKRPPVQTENADKQAVNKQVTGFGKQLSMVSLQAPADTVAKSIRQYYEPYISPRLMDAWTKNPQKAPGRVTSSPWPDRIDILSTTKTAADAYEVKGKIIEITSEEKVNGGVAAKRPITLKVKKIDNRWLINEITVGDYEESQAVTYTNTQYGFSFSLPAGWKGYTIVNDEWQGSAIGDEQSEEPVETGPIVSIRHPLWTAQEPRQDIPIMIFTISQWDLLQNEAYHIGAAPMGPSELGRNKRYVFALPARYNYAFPTGFEEVEKILETKPLKPID